MKMIFANALFWFKIKTKLGSELFIDLSASLCFTVGVVFVSFTNFSLSGPEISKKLKKEEQN